MTLEESLLPTFSLLLSLLPLNKKSNKQELHFQFFYVYFPLPYEITNNLKMLKIHQEVSIKGVRPDKGMKNVQTRLLQEDN